MESPNSSPLFANKAWKVTAEALVSTSAPNGGWSYIPASNLLDRSDGLYAWPMRLSVLASADFEAFVDALRAAVSIHAAAAVDPRLLQESIELARRRLAQRREDPTGAP
jgi:hypothetical protein